MVRRRRASPALAAKPTRTARLIKVVVEDPSKADLEQLLRDSQWSPGAPCPVMSGKRYGH